MNCIGAFAIILIGTVLTALKDDGNAYWLLISDANVALALFIAWLFDKDPAKKGININFNIKRTDY